MDSKSQCNSPHLLVIPLQTGNQVKSSKSVQRDQRSNGHIRHSEKSKKNKHREQRPDLSPREAWYLMPTFLNETVNVIERIYLNPRCYIFLNQTKWPK